MTNASIRKASYEHRSILFNPSSSYLSAGIAHRLRWTLRIHAQYRYFFDGTGNNREEDKKKGTQAQSNVSRLSDASHIRYRIVYTGSAVPKNAMYTPLQQTRVA